MFVAKFERALRRAPVSASDMNRPRKPLPTPQASAAAAERAATRYGSIHDRWGQPFQTKSDSRLEERDGVIQEVRASPILPVGDRDAAVVAHDATQRSATAAHPGSSADVSPQVGAATPRADALELTVPLRRSAAIENRKPSRELTPRQPTVRTKTRAGSATLAASSASPRATRPTLELVATKERRRVSPRWLVLPAAAFALATAVLPGDWRMPERVRTLERQRLPLGPKPASEQSAANAEEATPVATKAAPPTGGEQPLPEKTQAASRDDATPVAESVDDQTVEQLSAARETDAAPTLPARDESKPPAAPTTPGPGSPVSVPRPAAPKKASPPPAPAAAAERGPDEPARGSSAGLSPIARPSEGKLLVTSEKPTKNAGRSGIIRASPF